MPENILLSLSSDQLQRALEIKKEIDQLESELNSIVGSDASNEAPAKKRRGRPKGSGKRIANRENSGRSRGSVRKTGGRRTMSPETRAKMAASQKRRWAKRKKGKS